MVPQTPQAEPAAFVYAQKLRNSQHLVRVEIELGRRSPEQIREYARNCRINRLAWVKADGTPVIETL